MFGLEVAGDGDAKCKFGRAEVINLPLGLKISLEVISLIVRRGDGNNVVDMDGKDGHAQVQNATINAPFIFHAFEPPSSDDFMERFVPDFAHLFHSIDTFV